MVIIVVLIKVIFTDYICVYGYGFGVGYCYSFGIGFGL